MPMKYLPTTSIWLYVAHFALPSVLSAIPDAVRRYGRKPTLVFSLMVNTAAVFGLAWTSIAAGLNICMWLMGVASIMKEFTNVIIGEHVC